MKSKASKINPGDTYVFTKSGNKVKAIEPCTPYMGRPCWSVARVDGASVGKGMSVLEDALVTEEEWAKSCS